MAKPEIVNRRAVGPAGPDGAIRASGPAYWLIAALLGSAVVLSAFLVSKHFGGGLPGCGPQSGCESLERTPWGMVPGIRWPVSFLGFAYFFALLVGWMVADRRWPFAARWLLGTGGAASILFIGVMVAYGKVCPYCAGIHAVNLTVVYLVERAARRDARPSRRDRTPAASQGIRKIATAGVGSFLAVSLVLGAAEARFRQGQRASAEVDRRESTEQILAQAEAQRQNQMESQAGEPPGQTLGAGATTDRWGRDGFTGRYRLGPEVSPVRIVMLTDYQCIDCQKVEREVEEILASRSDIALSVKHYPMCAEAEPGVPCNRYAKQTLHANACWAARAAEAAGILKGEAGFWEMHRWLFARGGVFTERDLQAALPAMGYTPGSFLAVMRGEETLRRVRADCEDGSALGLYFTPMVFINGVEFKGWQSPGALGRTIVDLAAGNPPVLDATADQPVLAATKDVQDWRDQPVRAMPPDTRSWTTGAAAESPVSPGTRPVEVVLFGDYQEPFSAAMDIAIRERIKQSPNVRYTFRHFPIDPKVNPTLPAQVRPEALHPLAGRAAQASEAAGSLNGAPAFWRVHDWLMRNMQTFSDASLRAAAPQLGVDGEALLAAMARPEVAAAIVEDARAAKLLGLNSVPMVFVNGKWVWRTTRAGENVALRVIDAAGRP